MADVAVDPECTDPKELFGQGVRAFILQDFESASVALSKASELLVQQHKDDMHDSLGEVYLFYGKSLLGLSREQNEALGDAVPKNSAEDSEEEEEEVDEGIESQESEQTKTEDGSTSSLNVDSSKTNQKEEEPNEEPEGDGDKIKKEDVKIGMGHEIESDVDGDAGPSSSKMADDEPAEDQNADDEPTDLQVAWEVLELAKKIFQRLGDKKSLAETLVCLGEVSLENESFEAAINDIKQALEIQNELYGKDSRTLAETLYKLGMAYSTNSQLDEAIDYFNHSLENLRNRIKMLEEMKPQTEDHKDEIDELNKIMPDIEEKIADIKVYKEEAIKEVVEAMKEPEKPTQASSSSSKEVTNISHLVKRKRKIDEVEEKPDGEVPAKKAAA